MHPTRLKGILLTSIGVLVLTPDALLIRLIGADVWTLLFWRGFLQGCALTLFLFCTLPQTDVGRKAAFTNTFRGIGWTGLVLAAFYALGNLTFIHSIRITSAANTLLIVSSSPMIAAMLSRIFLKEFVPVRTWIAAGFALVGIGVIVSGQNRGGSAAGDVLAVLTALLLAGSFVLARKAHTINMVPAVALSGFLMALLVVPSVPVFSVSATDAGYLFLLGAVIMPISFGLITLGPRYIPAAEVSLIMLLETVLGPFWVWLALHEQPPTQTLVGGGIVLVTLAVHAVCRADPRPATEDT